MNSSLLRNSNKFSIVLRLLACGSASAEMFLPDVQSSDSREEVSRNVHGCANVVEIRSSVTT